MEVRFVDNPGHRLFKSVSMQVGDITYKTFDNDHYDFWKELIKVTIPMKYYRENIKEDLDEYVYKALRDLILTFLDMDDGFKMEHDEYEKSRWPHIIKTYHMYWGLKTHIRRIENEKPPVKKLN